MRHRDVLTRAQQKLTTGFELEDILVYCRLWLSHSCFLGSLLRGRDIVMHPETGQKFGIPPYILGSCGSTIETFWASLIDLLRFTMLTNINSNLVCWIFIMVMGVSLRAETLHEDPLVFIVAKTSPSTIFLFFSKCNDVLAVFIRCKVGNLQLYSW